MNYVQQIKERFDEMRETILTWLQEQSDLPVVMASHSDPRPRGPHVSFKLLTSLRKIGYDELATDPTSGVSTVQAHREFTVAIEAVGNPVGPDDGLSDMLRATDILNAVHMSLDLPSVRSLFEGVCLAIISEGTVTDISQILETEVEPRALLELEFRARFDLEDDISYFDKVQVSGGFDTDCDGSEDINTGVIDIP